ncbi:MAG: amidohydrolase, partial [Oscillospiraceae bacterium]|nr:amidohydrolase [Oscillospiraceae bacterium]
MSILLKNGLVYLPDGTVSKQNIGIEGARIDYLAAEEPGRKYDEVKDMSGKLLIPGLVNAHTHAAMTLLRGVGSDLSLQDWLFEKIVPIEDKLTPDDIRVGTELAMLEMLACGTTSFSDMYFFPEVTAEAVISSGMKANLNRPVQSFDPSERGEDSRRIKEAVALYEDYNEAGNGRVKIDFCVHAEYTCTEAVTRYLADIVREKRGNLHIHLSETEKEQRQCIEKYGKTPLRWFYDLGALDSRAFCAHCVWVTDEDMELMTKLGIGAVHNPSSNLKLGSGFAPVQKMLDLGINVALGTDGAS